MVHNPPTTILPPHGQTPQASTSQIPTPTPYVSYPGPPGPNLTPLQIQSYRAYYNQMKLQKQMQITQSQPQTKMQTRAASPTSQKADYGSDTTSCSSGSDDDSEDDHLFEEAKDMDDVENWLLDSTQWDSPPPSPPPAPFADVSILASAPPISIFSSPGPLLWQLVLSVLMWFGLVSQSCVEKKRKSTRTSPIRKEIATLRPRPKPKIPDIFTMGDPMFLFSDEVKEPAYFEDDTEYIVHPRPHKRDDFERRIAVTRDLSKYKLKLHGKGLLRIYRVPDNDVRWFGSLVRGHGYSGQPVRLPVDEYDNIAVMRHGHHSTDFGGDEESWILVGHKHRAIRDVIEQSVRWAPPLRRRLWIKLAKLAKRIVNSL